MFWTILGYILFDSQYAFCFDAWQCEPKLGDGSRGQNHIYGNQKLMKGIACRSAFWIG